MQDPAKLTKVKVKIPFLDILEAEWEADPKERRAAWALYVELTTRISTQPLDIDEGLMTEALGSLYKLFDITRAILREAGPDVGRRSPQSVGAIALIVLNKGLRPFLARWHPELDAHMASRQPEVSIRDHERAWSQGAKLRGELHKLQPELQKYAKALATIAGIME